MDEGIEGFFVGVMLASIVWGFITLLLTITPDASHTIGWAQTACVTTSDITSGVERSGTKTTIHCVTGEELARWAQEKGR